MLRTDEANEFFGVRLNVLTSILVFLGALVYFLRGHAARGSTWCRSTRRRPRRSRRPTATSRRSTCRGRPAGHAPTATRWREAQSADGVPGASRARTTLPATVTSGTGVRCRPWPTERPRRAATGRRPARTSRPATTPTRVTAGRPTSADPRPRREAADVRTAVVVGAGMAGLAAAGALARAGLAGHRCSSAASGCAAPPTALVLWPNGRARPGGARPGRRLVGDRRRRCPTAASAGRTASGWSRRAAARRRRPGARPCVHLRGPATTR